MAMSCPQTEVKPMKKHITKHPIHYVRAWSGKNEDESPVCGADKNSPEAWGYRTHFVRGVTCEPCLERLGIVEKEHAEGDNGKAC